jgi:hypothetical protein
MKIKLLWMTLLTITPPPPLFLRAGAASQSKSVICRLHESDINDNINLNDSQNNPITPEHDDLQSQQASSTTHLYPQKRKQRQLVLVDSDIRRSLRIKAFNIVYKASGCGKRNCVGCELDPPSISTKVIKNLGEIFCKMDPKDLSIGALMAPYTSKRAIMKKQSSADGHVGQNTSKTKPTSKKQVPNGDKKKNSTKYKK